MATNPAGQNTTGGSTRRWKSTMEQKSVLESLHRQGIRSPSLKEIERITQHLQKYGPVEEKNVFYWFQNSNARDKEIERKKNMASQLLLSQPEPAASKPTALWSHFMNTSQSISVPRTQLRNEERMEDCLFFDHSCSFCNNVEKIPLLELFPLHPDRGGREEPGANH